MNYLKWYIAVGLAVEQPENVTRTRDAMFALNVSVLTQAVVPCAAPSARTSRTCAAPPYFSKVKLSRIQLNRVWVIRIWISLFDHLFRPPPPDFCWSHWHDIRVG